MNNNKEMMEKLITLMKSDRDFLVQVTDHSPEWKKGASMAFSLCENLVVNIMRTHEEETEP